MFMNLTRLWSMRLMPMLLLALLLSSFPRLQPHRRTRHVHL